MHSLRVGLAVGALGLVVLGGCMRGSPPAQQLPIGQAAPTTTVIASAWNGSGPGDGPPDATDNEMFPKAIRPADQQAGDAAMAKARTALAKVQGSGVITRTAVHNALVRAGFDPLEFYAVPTGPAITFGITVGGACVEGSVDRTTLDTRVQGPVPDWGCGIVGPTH